MRTWTDASQAPAVSRCRVHTCAHGVRRGRCGGADRLFFVSARLLPDRLLRRVVGAFVGGDCAHRFSEKSLVERSLGLLFVANPDGRRSRVVDCLDGVGRWLRWVGGRRMCRPCRSGCLEASPPRTARWNCAVGARGAPLSEGFSSEIRAFVLLAAITAGLATTVPRSPALPCPSTTTLAPR